MKNSEGQSAFRRTSGSRSKDAPPIRDKVELRFIEKPDRERPHSLSGYTSNKPSERGEQDGLLGAAPPSAEFVRNLDFGIGELAEEFATLSTLTPPPTPASLSSTSDVISVNGAGATGPEEDALSVSQQGGLLPTPRLLNNLPQFGFGGVGGAIHTFNTSYRHDLSHSQPIAIPNCSTTTVQSNRGTSSSGSSNNSPSATTSTSVSSSSSGSPPSEPPSLPPTRLVRRFQYWCRVLQMRRRHPMCRYCYERYVYMCLDLRQPIPAVHDRGMWHGHNMRERGLVTDDCRCPHLWSTTCPHCGATKQLAHTDDYCPLVRRGHMHPRVNMYKF